MVCELYCTAFKNIIVFLNSTFKLCQHVSVVYQCQTSIFQHESSIKNTAVLMKRYNASSRHFR